MLQLIEKHSTSAKSTEDVNEKKKSFPRYTKTFSLLPHKNNFTINYVPLNKSNLVSINESRKLTYIAQMSNIISKAIKPCGQRMLIF